jgi:S-adenosylmethionine synthetase
MRSMEPSIATLARESPARRLFEVVERKGLGHPDTVCDALVENLSAALARAYHERFGAVLHHNVDKALLVGGAARAAFGGGEVLEPMEIILAGRATRAWRGASIDVDALAIECSRDWLRRHLRHLEVERHVRIVPRIRPTSPDLAALFVRRPAACAPLANDTSIGAGFAPLDALERGVLAAERALNAPALLEARPGDGEDVKVLGVRRGASIALTVARALVGRHVRDLDDYRVQKARIGTLAAAAAAEASGLECAAEVNSADGDEAGSVYLTVTGLSAEAGDDGQVGRGNRVNGLITPDRPMSLEAAAGKNPVTHVGKLYNVLAHRVAQALTAEIPGVAEAECLLVSRIGHPITEPQLADIRVRLDAPADLEERRAAIGELLHAHLARLPQLWRELLAGAGTLW